MTSTKFSLPLPRRNEHVGISVFKSLLKNNVAVLSEDFWQWASGADHRSLAKAQV